MRVCSDVPILCLGVHILLVMHFHFLVGLAHLTLFLSTNVYLFTKKNICLFSRNPPLGVMSMKQIPETLQSHTANYSENNVLFQITGGLQASGSISHITE